MKLITIIVWIITRFKKYNHCQWTGKDKYWIAFGKITKTEKSIKGGAHA